MNLLDKIALITKVKWKALYRNHRLFIFRKTSSYIHSTAKIQIKNAFLMNKSYGRQSDSRKGLFKLDENADFKCNDMLVYDGSTVVVHNNAKLHMGSGYVNCNSEIRSFNSITIGENVAIAK